MDCDHWDAAALAWFTMASASSGRRSKFRHGTSLLFHQLNALCSAGSQWSRLSQMHPNPGQRGSLFLKKKNPLWNEMLHTNQNRNGGKTKTLRSSRSWPKGKNSCFCFSYYLLETLYLLGFKETSVWKKFNTQHHFSKMLSLQKALKKSQAFEEFFFLQKSYCFVLNAGDKGTIFPSHWSAL